MTNICCSLLWSLYLCNKIKIWYWFKAMIFIKVLHLAAFYNWRLGICWLYSWRLLQNSNFFLFILYLHTQYFFCRCFIYFYLFILVILNSLWHHTSNADINDFIFWLQNLCWILAHIFNEHTRQVLLTEIRNVKENMLYISKRFN